MKCLRVLYTGSEIAYTLQAEPSGCVWVGVCGYVYIFNLMGEHLLRDNSRSMK